MDKSRGRLGEEDTDTLEETVDVLIGSRGGCPGASFLPTVDAREREGKRGGRERLSVDWLGDMAAETIGLLPGMGGGTERRVRSSIGRVVGFRVGILGGTILMGLGIASSLSVSSNIGLLRREAGGDGIGDGRGDGFLARSGGGGAGETERDKGGIIGGDSDLV